MKYSEHTGGRIGRGLCPTELNPISIHRGEDVHELHVKGFERDGNDDVSVTPPLLSAKVPHGWKSKVKPMYPTEGMIRKDLDGAA